MWVCVTLIIKEDVMNLEGVQGTVVSWKGQKHRENDASKALLRGFLKHTKI